MPNNSLPHSRRAQGFPFPFGHEFPTSEPPQQRLLATCTHAWQRPTPSAGKAPPGSSTTHTLPQR
uniref:Uncharacterized protein n=1 Tax=Arundo donax TaxID=35708 RepID=A0A0A8Z6U8_ARUDO